MASNRFDFLELKEEPEEQKGDVEVVDNEPTMFGPAHLKEPPAPPQEEPEAIRYSGYGRTQTLAGQTQPGYCAQPRTSAIHVPDTHMLRAEEVFGKRGSGIGEFNFPAGIAVDRAGILFVADVYNHRLQRITPDGAVAIVGARGSGRTQFLAPMAVAVDVDRSFYVVEQGNHRIQKFSSEGLLEMVLGRLGSRPGEFRSPMGICISNASGEILVADTGNGRVQRFSIKGEYLGSLGGPNSIHPPLANPQSVACDHIGNIYVADTLSNRIARYDPAGRFTGHFGGAPLKAKAALAPNVRFTDPHALACSNRGDLFIADGDHGPGHLVVMNAETGAVKISIEDAGRGLGKLQRPGGVSVAITPQGGFADGLARLDVYLADTMNHRIIRFSYA